MKAIWNDEVIAESNDTVIIENNHYFPKEAVKKDVLTASNTHTLAAKEIKDRIAFWKGVKIVE